MGNWPRLAVLFWLGLTMGVPAWRSAPAPAQAARWSLPQRVPDYYDLGHAPILAVDFNRTVHAFDYETRSGGDGAIYYRTWSLASGWSRAVDILLPPFLGGNPGVLAAFADQAGVLHLLYFNGNPDGGDIYYIRANAAEAGAARAWTEPAIIGPRAAPSASGAIIGDGQDGLVMLYSGKRSGTGVYAAYSLDGGVSWSEPALVALSSLPDTFIGEISLDLDEQHQVHAVWATGSVRQGLGLSVNYARLNSGWTQWELATQLAARDTDLELMGGPDVITQGQEVIVAYQDGFPPTKWVRRSADGGQSWSQPVRPFPHIGGYGPPVLLKDSANTIHMVMGNRVPDPEIHGMWYSRLAGNTWLPLEPITSGPSTASYDPCCPQAVISQGNVLLATWAHNVRAEGLTGAWYSHILLDTPELPVVRPASPTAPPPATPVTDATGTAAPAATSTPPVLGPVSAGTEPRNPSAPIMWSALPVAVIVILIAAWQRRRMRRL